MKRRRLFELEDQCWLPPGWRDGATDVLDVLFAMARAARPLAPALQAFMAAAEQRRWFDLGSGFGGGALAMRAELKALVLVPRVAPFRWSLLLWTYVIPAIPIVFAWDGTVSTLRAYTPQELLTLAKSVSGADGYEWTASQIGRSLILTGRPRVARQLAAPSDVSAAHVRVRMD